MVLPIEIQTLRAGILNINQGAAEKNLDLIKDGVSQIEAGFTLADGLIQSGSPRSDDLREKISTLAWEVLRFLIQANLNAQALRIVKLVQDRAGKLVFQPPKAERLPDSPWINESSGLPFRFSMDEEDFLSDLEGDSQSIKPT